MGKVILLVDDDTPVREAVRDTLELEGYTILEAASGNKAISVIEREEIDLVVTDVLMPDGEGIGLAFNIQKTKPGLKIIGMTGGGNTLSADSVEEMCDGIPFEVVLRKPFPEEELLGAITAALS